MHRIKTIDGGQRGKVLMVLCETWLQYVDLIDLAHRDSWYFDNSDTELFQDWNYFEEGREIDDIHPLVIFVEHHPLLEPGLYRTFVGSDFAIDYKPHEISHARFMRMYEGRILYNEEDLWEAMDQLEDVLLEEVIN